MNETTLQALSLITLLVTLPLISLGVTVGVAALWWLGLALLLVGGLIPAALRYVSPDDD